MSNNADLLRLLEPTVRPIAQPTASPRVGNSPFEQQDFDSLLSSFQDPDFNPAPETGVATETQAPPQPGKHAGPLAELADIGRIENSTLRNLLAQRLTTDA